MTICTRSLPLNKLLNHSKLSFYLVLRLGRNYQLEECRSVHYCNSLLLKQRSQVSTHTMHLVTFCGVQNRFPSQNGVQILYC